MKKKMDLDELFFVSYGHKTRDRQKTQNIKGFTLVLKDVPWSEISSKDITQLNQNPHLLMEINSLSQTASFYKENEEVDFL
jgi:hypothetical protein